MRNLKRALSLGLTAAMISGLMVMGSSAAGYADVTSENNQEAIEVLQAVGIMTGVDEEGNFNPDGTVTRNQMAVIMANLMEYNVASYRDTSPFTDVPSWAEPYVAACYTNGITSGYSDTIYGGEDSVTTAQAALMLMKALGYFQYASDFGQEWQLATLKQGNAIDLFVGVDSRAEDPLTRNDVAQLVLNTLKAGTVEANTSGSIEIGGVVINNNVTYSYVTSNQAYANAISTDRSTSNNSDAQRAIVELGEQLYMGDLKLDENETDVFGRPARYWEYEGSEIGTYAKTELLKQSYTTKVTGKDLYDLLGSNIVDHYNFNITIDGVTDYDINKAIFDETSINRNNKAGVGATGNGVLTEVYVDTDEDVREVSIAIINTYLAIANDDYNERQDDVSLEVYGVQDVRDEYVKTTGDDNHETLDVSGEDFDIADVAEDDLFLVNIAAGEIQVMGTPEAMEGVEVSSFKKNSSLTVDGTDYDYASSAEYDHDTLKEYTDGNTINLKDMTYNVYLDQYGYVIGVVEVEKPNNYLFITGLNGNYSNLANVTYEANAIFLDGTMEKITIDSKKSDFGKDAAGNDVLTGTENDATINAWFTYSVNSKDVYTVDLVEYNAGIDKLGQSTENRGGNPFDPAEVIDYKHDSTYDECGKTGNKVYGNDYTVYLTASIDAIKTADEPLDRYDVVIDDVDSVAVGIDNVDIQPWNEATVRNKYTAYTAPGSDLVQVSHGIYTLYDEDGYIIAMVVVGEDNGANDSLVYVHSGSVSRESYDKTTEEWTWTRSVIMDGEEVTLTEVDDTRLSMLDKMDENKWYRVRFNADGEVNSVRSDNVDDDGNKKENERENGNGHRLDQDLDFAANWELYTYTSTGITGLVNIPYGYVDAYNATVGGLTGINAAINVTGVDTVLYHEGFMNNAASCDGKTLYVTQAHDGYVRFTDDTKVVFEQMNNNEWDTEFWTGESGVKRAIRELHEKDGTTDRYDYIISAVIEDGRASVIIIHDMVEHGNSGTTPTPDATSYEVITSDAANDYNGALIFAPTDAASWSNVQALNALAKKIADDGNTLVQIDTNNNTITWLDSSMGNVEKVTALPAADEADHRLYKVELNGKSNYMLAGQTVGDKDIVATVDWDVDWKGGYFLSSNGMYRDVTGPYAYQVKNANADKNGVITIKDGYYEVTVRGYSLDEDYNTPDDDKIFMKPGETVQITIDEKDWRLVEPIDNSSTGFTFANCEATNATGCTVDMTAPSTMDTDTTVTIAYQSRS